MPDNSTAPVNLFLKYLDRSWNVNDLHSIFTDFGEIKSAKISLNPKTHKSNGYGFIWFKHPESAAKVLEANEKKQFPFHVEPYKPRFTSFSSSSNSSSSADLKDMLQQQSYHQTKSAKKEEG